MLTSLLELWTDGAARPNKGPAGIGVVGKIEGRSAFEFVEHIGRSTNNAAEYTAVIQALQHAIDIEARRVLVRVDSMVVFCQYRNEWRCREQSLIELLGRVRDLASEFEEFEILRVPREENREADKLSVAGALLGPRFTGRRILWSSASE
jgi:ribonuclease HI